MTMAKKVRVINANFLSFKRICKNKREYLVTYTQGSIVIDNLFGADFEVPFHVTTFKYKGEK